MAKFLNLGSRIIQLSKPNIEKFWYYAKVELVPPKPSEISVISNKIGKILTLYKSGQWKELTVKEVFLNSMVATEVFLWFFIGECIGKGSLIGYDLGL